MLEKKHRFLSYNRIAKKAVTGYCMCRETYDDSRNLVQFTEFPSTNWHRSMLTFSSFRPEVEALQATESPWAEKLTRYSEKFQFTFYPAQLREAAKLLSRDAALVTAEVGSGKTLLASAFLGLRTTRKSTVVIVTPTGVHPQWQEELGRFAGRRATSVDDPSSLAAGINLINIEAFRASGGFNRTVDCIIADESAFLSSYTAQSAAFLLATFGIPLRLALSATPVPNRLEELFLVLGWLSGSRWYSTETPSELFPYLPSQCQEFKRDYCLSEGAIGVPSPERIQKLLEPFIINLTKAECRSDMPPMRIKFVPCSIPESVHASWVKCFKPGVPSNTETDFLTASPRVLGKSVVALSKLCHFLGAGEQVLIIAVRQEPLQMLRAKLEASSVPTSMIFSDASTDHAGEAENFRTGKSRAMLMGMKSAMAYNFPLCHRVIILGADFTFGMFYQSLGRAHRLNSEVPVTVDVLYYAGTNEAIKINTVLAKAEQASAVVGARDYNFVGQDLVYETRTVPDSEAQALWDGLNPAPIADSSLTVSTS